MKMIKGDGIGGRGITLEPRNGEYSKVVLWFHGLGDTADGWASMMPEFGIEDTKFILPTADTRPISLNMGMPMPGWSDIYGLDHNAKEDNDGFTHSADRVHRIIQNEIDNSGIDGSKIVVGGFSQGGALALHVALRHSTVSFAACIALSTWLPLRDDYPESLSEKAKHLPIFQAHGTDDNIVGHQWGLESHNLLKSYVKTPEPQFLTVQRMGHSSHPDEMAAVKAFLERVLA